MNIPTVGAKGRRKSLGRQNVKTKQAKKNILWVEDELDYKPTKRLDPESVSKVTAMLKTVLSSAHIYNFQQKRYSMELAAKQDNEEKFKEAKLKRKQLLFGANVVCKGLQSGNIACAVFADDIVPLLLKSQMQILCRAKNIPYLDLPKLREITRKALGFPCIVIGFKKETADFQSAVDLVTSIYKTEEERITQSKVEQEENPVPDTSVGASQSTEENDDSSEDEKPFEYLYRDPVTGKRAYIPEEHPVTPRRRGRATKNSVTTEAQVKPEPEPEPDLDAETEADESISAGRSRGRKRKIPTDSGGDDEEGQDFSFEYNVAKIIKLHGNPGREKKKFKKLKQKTEGSQKKI